MSLFKRNAKNPILVPNSNNDWEKKAVFNASIIKDDSYHFVYRALSEEQTIDGKKLNLSTIGYSKNNQKDEFLNRRQLITPSEDWDKFGLEDPRITKIDDEYFVFYTALSVYPFYPAAIKVGVATFTSLAEKPQKHLVTPFNAKAMTLFPQKINGKYAALLTVNTDIPPSFIALALFDKKEDIWSQFYWRNWYQNLPQHILPLARINTDQLEIGTSPVLTKYGWLILYAHIQHYYNEEQRLFGVEAVLLDFDNPQKIIARTTKPILAPEEEYEQKGMVNNAIFPSGILLEDDTLSLYYGAADTTVCLATCKVDELIKQMTFSSPTVPKVLRPLSEPLFMPSTEHNWESKAVFNPAAFIEHGTIHLIYRAMDQDNTSVLGHATSLDGITITDRSKQPIYKPRAYFELKTNPNANSGCEDPRISRIGDRLYMCYTAYNGKDPPRVALTSIGIHDFEINKFNWTDPVLISPPGIDDKDATIFPEKIDDNYIIIHRTQNAIVFDKVPSLSFDGKTMWLRSLSYITPREDSWDSEKIGISTPPIKTDSGWLVFYHGISKYDHMYRVGAMLLDIDDPTKVLARTPWPILEPEMSYEKHGLTSNVVFPCSAVVKNDTLYIYYGGADSVVCVATISFSLLISYLLDHANIKIAKTGFGKQKVSINN